MLRASGIRLSELAGIRYDPQDSLRSGIDVWQREITVAGKGGRPRIVRIDYDAARAVRFRHHFSRTWLERGGPEGDLMELSGWSSPQMLVRYGASARGARARRTYDRIMAGSP